MKLTEEQRINLCNLIKKSLNNVKLQNYIDDNDDGYQLVDFLSTGKTIKSGEEEISNIVEQIYFDMENWVI